MDWALIEQGYFTPGGVTVGKGVVVATARYAAFVPTERPTNLAGEIAWAAAGFIKVEVSGAVNPAWVIHHLRSGPLDHQVGQICSAMSGLVWRPHEARAYEKKFPLRRQHRGLWFRAGGRSIRLKRTVPLAEFDYLRHQLAGWTWM